MESAKDLYTEELSKLCKKPTGGRMGQKMYLLSKRPSRLSLAIL